MSSIYKIWAVVLLLAQGNDVLGYRPVVQPKQQLTTSEEPSPWYRTIYSDKVELVTPTVIAGVTFSRKPLETADPLEPWVSLDKQGSPKTINPEIKNGRTKKAHPDYSTYFKNVYTKTLGYEDLKAHNMDYGDTHEELTFEDEDDTYTSLNPLIRCTPQRYFNKGLTQNVPSDPFCTPHEDSMWHVGKTYFLTWYTHFFKDEHSNEVADRVRVHMAYVKEKANEKGMLKREPPSATFFKSEWIKNVDGVFPVEVLHEWLQGVRTRKVVISVQPEYVPDEEFDPLLYGVFVFLDEGSKVFKHTKEELALRDAGITDDKWYYVAISIPTMVILSLVLMYFFINANRSQRDFSDITNKTLKKKHRVLGKVADMKKFKSMKNRPYSELPTYNKGSSGKQH
ncbi:YKL077W [Zygosaccharomyces parabailii]|uniref:BN860_18426g1_1 n=1 Tax=Zygosaccharomyces bailii (strain CLIB 213 / ATCC 58445 / CBS 680 / BCRC 21525 / NBRC 1098 / NCYC 1416 / NRRL Y-2227) TaxID=1333698 RepID=A0A8J2WVN5_ZYGB2|nr:YKL077W [Zygosaccharomyces parabailii]CDF87961.1 BN860_18426g1_1 [Zygosaccharomyces bailii CLIB 213]CDH12213.1 uncharacterized protein ZBAI_03999 [Zygosaccharomyces bailii ISA1307]SJM83839.1 uncharacterized protein ZBIST_1316 [Zygosaccharomyces bailii]